MLTEGEDRPREKRAAGTGNESVFPPDKKRPLNSSNFFCLLISIKAKPLT